MEHYIYLDQNTLTDLRARKLIDAPDRILEELKTLCAKEKVRIIYSETHLQEINQIPRQEFKEEHISLLNELGAAYVIPISTELSAKDPELVWKDFIENEQDNERMCINKVVSLQDMINRKFSGLPVDKSFQELNEELKEALTKMLTDSAEELSKLNPNELADGGEEAIKLAQAQMAEQLQSVSEMIGINIPNEQELGPKPLKELGKLQELDIENRSPKEVIPLLDGLFNMENSDFRWSDYFDDTTHNQIARCYSLMNWAGYYSDDFTKIKKRGDRFRASNNDLMHVRNAAGSSFLVSKDQAFLRKAEACYKHLNVPTIVCRPEQLIEYL